MKKSILLSIIIGLIALPLGNATTVGFGATPGSRSVVNRSLASVAPGSLIWMGTFASETFSFTGSTIAQAVANIIVDGGWTQFPGASGTFGLVQVGAAGTKVGNSLTNNTAAANAFDGLPVYLWIFDSTAVATATQMGIYKATAATIPWLFPQNKGGVGDDVVLSTAASGSTMAAVGGVGSVNGTQIILAVPEPSTGFLSALGLMAMASRRRRNRN